MNVRDAKPGTKVKKEMGIAEQGEVIERFPWKEATDGTYKEPGMREIPVRWADGTKGYIDVAILKEAEDE